MMRLQEAFYKDLKNQLLEQCEYPLPDKKTLDLMLVFYSLGKIITFLIPVEYDPQKLLSFELEEIMPYRHALHYIRGRLPEWTTDIEISLACFDSMVYKALIAEPEYMRAVIAFLTSVYRKAGEELYEKGRPEISDSFKKEN